MLDFETISVAVAFVLDDQQRLLLTWNENWQAFTMPMTRPNREPPAESTEAAAARAFADALKLPARVVPGKSSRSTRELQVSGRDGEIKNYVYAVTPIEPHPDFRARALAAPAAIWAPSDRLDPGGYQPLSASLEHLLLELRQWGWL